MKAVSGKKQRQCYVSMYPIIPPSIVGPLLVFLVLLTHPIRKGTLISLISVSLEEKGTKVAAFTVLLSLFRNGVGTFILFRFCGRKRREKGEVKVEKIFKLGPRTAHTIFFLGIAFLLV